MNPLEQPRIVSLEQWITARTAHLRNEKEIMDWVRRHDEYQDTVPARACHAD